MGGGLRRITTLGPPTAAARTSGTGTQCALDANRAMRSNWTGATQPHDATARYITVSFVIKSRTVNSERCVL